MRMGSESVRTLDGIAKYKPLSSRICNILTLMDASFEALRELPMEAVGDALGGFLQTLWSERVRGLEEEVERITAYTMETQEDIQGFYTTTIVQDWRKHLDESRLQSVHIGALLNKIEANDTDDRRAIALCIVAALESGFEPLRSEKWIRDIFNCIHPTGTGKQPRLPPLLSRRVKRAILPILRVRDFNIYYGFITGERFFSKRYTDTRCADTYAVYDKTFPPGPPTPHVFPTMWTDFVEFK
ncbi:hypothetical protein FGB62_35g09 [Gracilaria domingensis]|nr:hypothetical protein FGB62_35g09 [Gracilaria domingensis]